MRTCNSTIECENYFHWENECMHIRSKVAELCKIELKSDFCRKSEEKNENFSFELFSCRQRTRRKWKFKHFLSLIFFFLSTIFHPTTSRRRSGAQNENRKQFSLFSLLHFSWILRFFHHVGVCRRKFIKIVNNAAVMWGKPRKNRIEHKKMRNFPQKM